MVENLFFSTLNGQRERVSESRAQSKSMWGDDFKFQSQLVVYFSERTREKEREREKLST